MTLGIADIVAILLIVIGPQKAAIVYATLTAAGGALSPGHAEGGST